LARKTLSVIVPCFNEEQVISTTHGEIVKNLSKVDDLRLEIVYVDDGSGDKTLEILRSLAENETSVDVVIVSLTRNFGHQPAITAGLERCSGDVVVVIDADLQDPPEVVVEMLDLWRHGYDVVNAVRTKRKEGFFLKIAYFAFYRLYNRMASVDVQVDAGDFCLMDRRVVDQLNRLPERNRFVRGLRSWIGFKQTTHSYERRARVAGETKYPFSKLVQLAFDGIFNFSTLPLTFVFVFGVILSLLAFALIVFLVLVKIFGIVVFGNHPDDIPGYYSTISTVLLFSGIQLVSLGIIGEYIGRIYLEVKNRPTYVAYEDKDTKLDSTK